MCYQCGDKGGDWRTFLSYRQRYAPTLSHHSQLTTTLIIHVFIWRASPLSLCALIHIPNESALQLIASNYLCIAVWLQRCLFLVYQCKDGRTIELITLPTLLHCLRIVYLINQNNYHPGGVRAWSPNHVLYQSD